jgi:hypothetical protein
MEKCSNARPAKPKHKPSFGVMFSTTLAAFIARRVTDPVGTLITERPPDRSVRARLRIRLL